MKICAHIYTDPTGKSSFFVINQANIPEVPKEELSELEAQCKILDDQVKALQAEEKQLQQGDQFHDPSKIIRNHLSSELNKIKSTPNDEELTSTNEELKLQVSPRTAMIFAH